MRCVQTGASLAVVILAMAGFASADGRESRVEEQGTAAAQGVATAIATNASDTPRRWCAEVSVAEGAFILEVDDYAFTFQGDERDPGQILVSISGCAEPVTYRFWPNLDGWQLNDEWTAHYAREFAGMAGWRDREIQVCVDADSGQRRVWVNGRLVRSWRTADSSTFRLAMAESGEQRATPVRELDVAMGRFLEMDLNTYFNDGPKIANVPDAFIRLDGAAGLR